MCFNDLACDRKAESGVRTLSTRSVFTVEALEDGLKMGGGYLASLVGGREYDLVVRHDRAQDHFALRVRIRDRIFHHVAQGTCHLRGVDECLLILGCDGGDRNVAVLCGDPEFIGYLIEEERDIDIFAFQQDSIQVVAGDLEEFFNERFESLGF